MNLGVYKYSDTGIKCELPLEKERNQRKEEGIETVGQVRGG